MTSRERVLTALRGGQPDYIPCCFMLFFNLWRTARTRREYVEKQLTLGMDAYVPAGLLKHSLHPQAQVHDWQERRGNETIFSRRIDTPAGPLCSRVVQRNGWPTCEHLPLFDDWLIPRTEEFLVKPEQDLEKARYLFGPFRNEHIEALRCQAQESNEIAREHQLCQIGGWQALAEPGTTVDYGVMGADALAWLSGYVPIMELSLTRPAIIGEYLSIIHDWNLKQIELYLEMTAADCIWRRGWYETCEFWTPKSYAALIAPLLHREVELVHQAGKLFGYIITSAFTPILDTILDCGVDVLIGLDPVEGKGTELATVKHRFREKGRALWGGVSGALTVELGTEKETEEAVLYACTVLGKGGGFILSPVDNIREDTENAWKNTKVLINTWKQCRSQ
ncbi:MAG TPA: hypothetical protein VLH40_00565 [Atribacteraceae bacterium]|nr:hypothetical protein [Atribacteraceae bacterium]